MSAPFDFDRWMRLAKEEPKRFEELRLQMIEDEINHSTPANQARLRGLQFQIDTKRRLSSSAMGACVEISTMMFDHLYNDLLTTVNAFLNGDFDELQTSSIEKAKVIPLYKK